MPIYVAKRYDGVTLSIALARSKELAIAYWQGQSLIPHSVSEITENDLTGHPTGVLPLLRTQEKEVNIDGFHNRKNVVLVRNT